MLQLVEEHGEAATRLLGMEERKVSHTSTWSASCDIIKHIFDDYVRYELWSVGVMATDWVCAYCIMDSHMHTHIEQFSLVCVLFTPYYHFLYPAHTTNLHKYL